ncbi:MAG: hypothetical protein PHF79_01415 [Candidatus Pacebacteria bacterium]|nr:hypothetical protein [Candidatus Paceibacterota bacterium]
MKTKERVHNAISAGLVQLASRQRADGGFGPVVFSAALIANCLGEFPDDRAKKICDGTCVFLLDQKRAESSWNYQVKSDKQHRAYPELISYPDDLDDTSRAFLALAKTQSIKEADWAWFVHHLTDNETAPGGPYCTWLNVDKEKWSDIDPVVNSAIAETLAIINIDTPGLTKYLEDILEKSLTGSDPSSSSFSSNYYHLPYFFWWSMSRWYRGEKKDLFVKQLTKIFINVHDKTWQALLASSLIRLGGIGAVTERFILDLCKQIEEKLYQLQNTDLYIEKIDSCNETTYAHSDDVTLAIKLEGLFLYASNTDQREKIHQEIVGRVKRNKSFTEALDLVLLHDANHSITLLPYDTLYQLIDPNLIKTHHLERAGALGAASLLGWIAHRIYDDIFDDGHKTQLLHVARLAENYARQAYGAAYSSLYDSYVSRMITAEISNGLSLKYLAEKSIGHSLSVRLMCDYLTNELGEKTTARLTEQLDLFFYHYLIARQLCDDAHDQEEDARRGKMTLFAKITDPDQAVALIKKHLYLADQALSDRRLYHLKKLLQPLISGIESVKIDNEKKIPFLCHYTQDFPFS